MTSRERVRLSINHIEPDRVPIDIGGTGFTGIAASTMHYLRKYLNLEQKLVKVAEPFSMVGITEDDLRQYFNVDVIGLPTPETRFGYNNTKWGKWENKINGVDILVDEKFRTKRDTNGDILAYPKTMLKQSQVEECPKTVSILTLLLETRLSTMMLVMEKKIIKKHMCATRKNT